MDNSDLSDHLYSRDGWRGDGLTVLGVLLAHIVVLVLAVYSKPDLVVPQRSEITVEVGVTALTGAAGPVALQATAQTMASAQAPASPSTPEPEVKPQSEQIQAPPTKPPEQQAPDTKPEPVDTPETTPSSEPDPAPEPVPTPAPVPKAAPKPEPKPKPPVAAPKPAPRPAQTPSPQTGSSTNPTASGATSPSAASTPSGGGGGGGGGGAVVDADYKAAYLRNPKPPYPPLALKMRIEGTVTLRVLVLEDGSSGKIVLSKSSGNDALDQSALETVAKWKFSPAKSQGQSVAQWVSIPINFSIKRR